MKQKIFYIIFIIFLLSALCFVAISKDCGLWRWPVKTCQDMKVNIDSLKFDILTADQLKSYDIVYRLFKSTPRLLDENKLVTVKGVLILKMQEADNDFHIVVRVPASDSLYIICEIPDPNKCMELQFSPFATSFRNARKFVNDLCKYGSGRVFHFSGMDTIFVSGFLFHDMAHNCGRFHMPHYLEIHPVIGFQRCN